MKKETDLIKLVQHPVITHSLELMGASVTERLQSLNIEKQVATEDTIKTLKEIRAELNKESKEFESQRKGVKDAIMNPYNEFESTYKKEIIEKYKYADELLKTKINDFEMKVKQEKKENLISYFNELIEIEQVDWLTFDRLGIDITLSTSEKKYKEQILLFVQKLVDDLELIKTDTYSAEILVEFKKNLNCSQAIKLVRDRKQAEKEEADKLQAERTSRRTSQLRCLNFVYHDLTKTYNWVQDETLYISYEKIENLSDENWANTFDELKESTIPKEEIKPEVLKAPIVEQPKQEPIQEKEEEVQAEIFEAKFIVKGTYAELKALGEFLKSNNYNYQNIK
ncbi:MAG: DUF1351 domain-containing protein [Dysgonomonas sp.]